MYPEPTPAKTPEPVAVEPVAPVAAEPVAPEPQPEAKPEQKIVVETQPESLAVPPAELTATKSPRGYVVLTIGLPGSGKTT